MASLPHLARFLAGFVFGYIGDKIRQHQWMTPIAVRKVFCIFCKFRNGSSSFQAQGFIKIIIESAFLRHSPCDSWCTVNINHLCWYGGWICSLCMRWNYNWIVGCKWSSSYHKSTKFPRFSTKLCGHTIFGDEFHRHIKRFYLATCGLLLHTRYCKWTIDLYRKFYWIFQRRKKQKLVQFRYRTQRIQWTAGISC